MDNDKLVDCIFIANIPNALTSQEVEEELRKLFSEFGNIDYIKFSKDNCSRPYSFLKFQKNMDFSNISSKKWFLKERQLRIEPAKSQKQLKFKDSIRNVQAESSQASYLFLLSARLQIENLNPEIVTRQRLWSLLNHQYGPIIKIYIHYFDKYTNKSVSSYKAQTFSYSNIGMIAFIDFANISNAERCFQIENGREWFGMNVIISKLSNSSQQQCLPPLPWYSPNNTTNDDDNLLPPANEETPCAGDGHDCASQ